MASFTRYFQYLPLAVNGGRFFFALFILLGGVVLAEFPEYRDYPERSPDNHRDQSSGDILLIDGGVIEDPRRNHESQTDKALIDGTMADAAGEQSESPQHPHGRCESQLGIERSIACRRQ